MKIETTEDYFKFAYLSLTDRQKKVIEIKYEVSKHLGNKERKKHKEISKDLPVSRERVTDLINYTLPAIEVQWNNWHQNNTVMFEKMGGEIVFEYLPINNEL